MVFFFNDTATTEIYTLSLHDALPIYAVQALQQSQQPQPAVLAALEQVPDPVAAGRAQERRRGRAEVGVGVLELLLVGRREVDRKSTRLNSSHANISYAVFCL